MKAIITLHPNSGSDLSEVIVRKGKRLVVNQAENNTFTLADDGHLIGVYPNVKSLELKGKPLATVELQNGYGTPSIADQIAAAITRADLSDHLKMCIAHGILKAEQLADEKSQARWAVETNPVATAHPDFEAFINSKMTSEDCAQFGVLVAREERNHYKARVMELEEALINVQADVEADDLPQAMQDREMLYARVTELQNRIGILDGTTPNFDDQYTRGLLNGMLTAESIMTGEPAKLVEDPAVVEERRYKGPIPTDASPTESVTIDPPNDESNTPHGADRGAKKK